MKNFGGNNEIGAQFVGLAGTLGAGKDTGAEHLAQEHGYLHVSTGDLLRNAARSKGLDTDRNTLIQLGIDLRAEYGSQGALVIKASELWQEDAEHYPGGCVVTGMRAIGEAQEVIALGGTLFFVEASVEGSHSRIASRRRDDEAAQTLEQFKTHWMLEMHGDTDDPTRPNLGAIKKISHFVLRNDSDTPESYLRALDSALNLSH